jgi:hypothetical protein
LKTTVPVGVPPEAAVTVAVKVTDWPDVLFGLELDATAVVVLAAVTDWVRVAEVEAVKFAGAGA